MALSAVQQHLPIYFPLQIVVRRLTCMGMQYSIMDTNEEYTSIEVATIRDDKATCTCEQSNCKHIQVALEKEAMYKAEAAKREAYCSVFGIYA